VQFSSASRSTHLVSRMALYTELVVKLRPVVLLDSCDWLVDTLPWPAGADSGTRTVNHALGVLVRLYFPAESLVSGPFDPAILLVHEGSGDIHFSVLADTDPVAWLELG